MKVNWKSPDLLVPFMVANPLVVQLLPYLYIKSQLPPANPHRLVLSSESRVQVDSVFPSNAWYLVALLTYVPGLIALWMLPDNFRARKILWSLYYVVATFIVTTIIEVEFSCSIGLCI